MPDGVTHRVLMGGGQAIIIDPATGALPGASRHPQGRDGGRVLSSGGGLQAAARSAGLKACGYDRSCAQCHNEAVMRSLLRGPTSLTVLMLFALTATTDTASSRSCESLADVRLPNTTIMTAQAVVEGSFTPPGSTNAISNLPSFC